MTTKLSEEQLNKVIELFDQGLGSRKIAANLSISRNTVVKAYKQLNLNSKDKKFAKYAFLQTEKVCKICNNLKSTDNFRQRIKQDRVSYEAYCLVCEKEYNKNSCKIRYRKNISLSKQYREKYKKEIKEYNDNYRLLNKDALAIKRRLKKKENNERLKKYCRHKRKTDPAYKLRSLISCSINNYLKKSNSSKNKQSCLKYLDYSIKELREHIEKQFEPWMNWDNHGRYNLLSWNENDESTWTWQIDHIIPQSVLVYSSMEEDNFKKCWALNNLRPYSAKLNLTDGVNRSRHNTNLA